MMSLLVIGLLMFAWLFDNGWLPDTPQQHEQRLSCEMRMMDRGGGAYNSKPLPAADAEAYCEKEMEVQKMWDANHNH